MSSYPYPFIAQPKPEQALGKPKSPQNSLEHDDRTAFAVEYRISRTPSPTPSEVEALEDRPFPDWERMRTKEYWMKKETIIRFVILAVVLALVILLIHYKTPIINALSPSAEKLRDMTGGWLIPVAILVVISFPPLFGHEIVAILCGVVWGIWIGFGIVALGTLLGEIANFYVFRTCCLVRGQKLEKTNISYGCLARVLREGGFMLAIIARYSAYPAHMLTAVFSTCGTSPLVYLVSCVLSLPKQLSIVYTGYAFAQSGEGEESHQERIITIAVIAVMVIVTMISLRILKKRIAEVKPQVVYARRKYRQQKLDEENTYRINEL